MKLIRCEIYEVPKARRNNSIYNMLYDFYESDMTAARIQLDDGEYKDIRYLVNAVRAAARKLKLHSVHCVVRKGEAFLYKENE